jgi:hypothetical protein
MVRLTSEGPTYKTGQGSINYEKVQEIQYWSAFEQPLLLWKSNKYYILWLCVLPLGVQRTTPTPMPQFSSVARLYNIFPHYLINDASLEKSYWTQNVCFDFLYSFWLSQFSI